MAAAGLADDILRPRIRLVLAWSAAILATAAHAWAAWHSYDTGRHAGDPTRARADGNFGHTLIDFAGQWVMARIVASGSGHELYSRPVQRQVIDEYFPRLDEAPAAATSDADKLYGWMVEVPGTGPDRPIGGALYPPTHAVLLAPLALLPPRTAYRTVQVAVVVLTWWIAWMFHRLSDGRIWWPVAALFVMGFSGFQGTIHLGQNSALSLAILTAGWLLVSRGRPFAGGLVWALLVYKPTWALAFALVPLATRRWRMLMGMGLGATAFVAATIPWVGIESWFDWLRIGRVAARHYELDENWVFLSRDLLNVPQRWLVDFQKPLDERSQSTSSIIGWVMWATVLGITLVLGWRRPAMVLGPAAAFVGLGAWLCCYHFVYYDSLLAALPVFLLLTQARWEWPTLHLPPFVLAIVTFLVVYELAFDWLDFEWIIPWGNSDAATNPAAGFALSTRRNGTPWDTFAVIALWIYSAISSREVPRDSAELIGHGID